ncbi:MAG: metallophosphoesterase [Theionarchaea archaeon]|nr:metallophosphoesterase [Theionarchaea archaeon]
MRTRPTILLIALSLAGLTLFAWQYGGSDASFSFAVVGDTQGSRLFMSIIEEVNEASPEFLLHLGDCVSISTEATIGRFSTELEELDVPFYITPGNHDIKGNSTLFYASFETGNYYFDHSGIRFISLDSSNQSLSEDQFSWLENALEISGRKVVFTHVPPYHPSNFEYHGFHDAGIAKRFGEMMVNHGVELVISGHIHTFNHTRMDSTDFVISGGGGGRLYAQPGQGGYQHFTIFHVDRESISYEVHRIEGDFDTVEELEISGRTGNVTLALEDILLMEPVAGSSSYQNSLGNWRGNGEYSGVKVSDLVDLVGGMNPGDSLVVESRDGYSQLFCHANVYPNATWREIQGYMVISYEFDGIRMPHWEEGFLVAFLPADGDYSNEDCLRSSCAGQGCTVYASAGARWVRDVARLRVLPG